MKQYNILSTIIRKTLIFLYRGLRPLLGPAECKYSVSCGDFAIEQLKSQPLFKALWAIIKRVASCNPFAQPKH